MCNSDKCEDEQQVIESPCISVCRLDLDEAICLGCGRTLDEIAAWSRLGSESRRQIMALLPARLQRVESAAGSGKPRPPGN